MPGPTYRDGRRSTGASSCRATSSARSECPDGRSAVRQHNVPLLRGGARPAAQGEEEVPHLPPDHLRPRRPGRPGVPPPGRRPTHLERAWAEFRLEQDWRRRALELVDEASLARTESAMRAKEPGCTNRDVYWTIATRDVRDHMRTGNWNAVKAAYERMALAAWDEAESEAGIDGIARPGSRSRARRLMREARVAELRALTSSAGVTAVTVWRAAALPAAAERVSHGTCPRSACTRSCRTPTANGACAAVSTCRSWAPGSPEGASGLRLPGAEHRGTRRLSRSGASRTTWQSGTRPVPRCGRDTTRIGWA